MGEPIKVMVAGREGSPSSAIRAAAAKTGANIATDLNTGTVITTAATGWLLGKHTIFGEVADEVSKKVVDKIEMVDTDGRDKPLDDVIIESITIEKI